MSSPSRSSQAFASEENAVPVSSIARCNNAWRNLLRGEISENSVSSGHVRQRRESTIVPSEFGAEALGIFACGGVFFAGLIRPGWFRDVRIKEDDCFCVLC